ncbi:MAG: beta-galactosidase [Candidatus Gastranaerophilales bacterium]|nr:beta-galactosidase [Candidatus Gastranaerophilales bacterium]
MKREEYSYNSQCLLKNGRPWFPLMGEMHYSRYRWELWEESLRKMKAGGVTIVSTYVIWIHHEEEQGVFDFTGSRDVRKFLELCDKVGLKVFLRSGPWVHGEVRNGGFPDWLMALEKDGVKLRSNDEKYLFYVRRFWEQVYHQVEGFFDKDGGPIIGMQLENEYGHVGGLKGEAGEAHMRTLHALARELGFDVPLYTATGWGGACIGDALPVMGGYCEAPWDRSTGELSANTNYVISSVRNDALIACDHHVEDAVTFDESRFPYLTAELGGGVQVTGHRRPVASGTDIGAMSTVKLASGVALLGYYMYHGGSNPEGKFSTLQESCDAGDLNNLPEINYDFNAPIRQYGAISDTYKEIKLLAAFLQDFGEDMAALPAEIETEDVRPEDMHTLRKSCRHDGEHGYVFFNNYQRRRTMEEHRDVVFEGICGEGVVKFPSVTIKSGAYGFFPYHMRLGDAVLKYALATPFCRLSGGGSEVFVFYGDCEPEFVWVDDKAAQVLHLSRAQALDAWKVTLERDYLVLSKNYVWEQEGSLKVTGEAKTKIAVYPELTKAPEGFVKTGKDGEFTLYERKMSEQRAKVEFVQSAGTEETAVYELTIHYAGKEDRAVGRDTILLLDYEGFGMDIYAGTYPEGKKINDHFYTGQQVPLSLGYFDFPEKLTVVVNALHEGDKVFLETWPSFCDGKACRLKAVEVREEYR